MFHGQFYPFCLHVQWLNLSLPRQAEVFWLLLQLSHDTEAAALGSWGMSSKIEPSLQEISQWPFQEPKLEVPTIYKAYFSGLCKGTSLENMALYGTNVPPF
jgi:hypothetical protein